ncbi:MAG: hypothetical protein M1830_003477, partial [Pleopsidium flavum]
MATTARQQPTWQPPPQPDSGTNLPPLKIWNSLTRSKTQFVPLDRKGKRVGWYACGPTVYDDAHLGHARNYVSTDIIRRILRDYFEYDVNFIMNITDVDDKIIVRGRQQHLLAQFVSKHANASDPEILPTALAAYSAYLSKNLDRIPPDNPPEQFEKAAQDAYVTVLECGTLGGVGTPGEKEAKVKMHIKTMMAASRALTELKESSTSSTAFYTAIQDILLPYLDSLNGASIDADDHSIFTKLTTRFERRFMEDVRALNCLDPDQVTRVTEYGPQIVAFVNKVVDNGFAYATSDGSVYFDINAFEAAGNSYARLEPWNRNDKELQADGEGALTKKTSEKKSDSDFALWKSSKPGEPSWPSPWGKGRPGWHIECSAMASDKLGERIDIHSGGIDLAFPHHDNELAQSEAYWLEKGHSHQHQWVNYFMHMGHLSIQGSKMSKSLKNFTTIREALERGDWTPRGLRVVFLLGGWKEGVEITDDLVKAGNAWEDKVNNFFINVRDQMTIESANPKADSEDALAGDLKAAKNSTFEALCDSFNTPTTMAVISDLITKYNSAEKATLKTQTCADLATWVSSMVNIFGLNGTAAPNENEIGWSGIDVPEAAKPYLQPLSLLRDELRSIVKTSKQIDVNQLQHIAKQPAFSIDHKPHPEGKPFYIVYESFRHELIELKNSSNLTKEVLQLCDSVRDIELWNLGIYLEDREGRPALVRRVTRDLVAAREEKAERERQKQKAKEDRDREAAKKTDKGRLSQLEMFRTNEYTA